MPPDEESSIERLKKRLYSRDERLVPKDHRTPVQGVESNVPTNWGAPKTFDLSPEAMTKKNNAFFNKFLLWSFVFFLLALGAAMFIFFGGINMISSNNVDIEITAGSSVSSGEELDMGLSIINTNRTDLEDVVLYVDYPEGSDTVGDNSQPIAHDKIDLDTIGKGQKKDYTLRTLLFGEKDTIKTFDFRLEYKVQGSNATFSKEKTFDVIIGSSPVLLNVNYPKEVNSGQEVTLSVDVTSNSSVPLKGTLVKIEYPYGFTYESSNIKPLRDNSVWNIGDLKNGDKKTLSVTGVIVGQNMEDRSFRISAGNQSSGASPDLDTVLAASTVTVGIRKAFFDLEVLTPGGAVGTAGVSVPVILKWQNTLPDKVVNNKVDVVISGNAFDRDHVTVGNNGFYQSVSNEVYWDKNTTSVLASLLPGDSGQVALNVASLPDSPQLHALRNPHIDLHVVMTGDRTGSDATQISSTQDFTIKIASQLGLTAKSFRSSGGFANTGPIPPKADTESTYTVTWTLANTTNDLSNGIVTATLPTGVVWKGQTSPGSEKVAYDPDTRTVTWSVGGISAGVGYGYAPRTVSFQVGITPSISQIGSSPNLVSVSRASAMDTYTAQTIISTADPVTTKYSDSNFVGGTEIVVK
jgi:hypothetical protein